MSDKMHKSKYHSRILPAASVYEYGLMDYAFCGQFFYIGQWIQFMANVMNVVARIYFNFLLSQQATTTKLFPCFFLFLRMKHLAIYCAKLPNPSSYKVKKARG